MEKDVYVNSVWGGARRCRCAADGKLPVTNNSTDKLPESLPAMGDAADERDTLDEGASFPMVGVGASVGGLEAFTQLLKALPLDIVVELINS